MTDPRDDEIECLRAEVDRLRDEVVVLGGDTDEVFRTRGLLAEARAESKRLRADVGRAHEERRISRERAARYARYRDEAVDAAARARREGAEEERARIAGIALERWREAHRKQQAQAFDRDAMFEAGMASAFEEVAYDLAADPPWGWVPGRFSPVPPSSSAETGNLPSVADEVAPGEAVLGAVRAALARWVPGDSAADDMLRGVAEMVGQPCETCCAHGSACILPAGHDPPDRHETAHGCVAYDPRPPSSSAETGNLPAETGNPPSTSGLRTCSNQQVATAQDPRLEAEATGEASSSAAGEAGPPERARLRAVVEGRAFVEGGEG
jgi:hypothetical protein